MTPVGSEESASAQIVGDGLSAASSLLAHAQVTGVALEFGTLSIPEILSALRADAWLHGYGDPMSDRGSAIRQQVLDAFFVDNAFWKGMIVAQSLTCFRQALAGLSGREP